MNKIFNAFLKEAEFTYEMLCSGYNDIQKTNYYNKGIYFQAFTSLSTGLEKIGKICLLIDYAIINNGNFPESIYVKKYKHNIFDLYKETQKIKEKYDFNFTYLQNLSDPLTEKIIIILSKFGGGERYSNIDFLENTRNYNDPINEWYTNVDKYFIKNFISKKNLDEFIEKANISNKFTEDIFNIYFIDEIENEITNIFDVVIKNNINNLVGKIRQLYFYRIIRYFVELLFKLEKYTKKKII